jgi:RecA-family ATPase
LPEYNPASLEYLIEEAQPTKEANAIPKPSAEATRKRFRTIKELYSMHDKPVEWLVPGILPKESLVSIQGRPKCGKSTFVFAMLKALTEGGEFLGKSVRPIRVVYLSEQNRVSFCQQLKESAFNLPTENTTVMTVEDFYSDGWQKNFDAAQNQVSETGASLLVVDSWGKFAIFSQQEDEYQSGPTQTRVNKLRDVMSATGASVLIIHHTGKQQGRALIDAGLGATALAAQVDQAFSLIGEPQQQAAESKNMQNERCRSLQSAGRFTDAFRDIQIERLEDGSYRFSSVPQKPLKHAARRPPEEVLLQELFAANPDFGVTEAKSCHER